MLLLFLPKNDDDKVRHEDLKQHLLTIAIIEHFALDGWGVI